MAFQLREGQGNLFKNQRKAAESHPDYKGQMMVNGVMYDLAAWIKFPKEQGKKTWMSLKLSLPQNKTNTPGSPSPQTPPTPQGPPAPSQTPPAPNQQTPAWKQAGLEEPPY